MNPQPLPLVLNQPADRERSLVDILPQNETHLMGGASGAGKTTFTIELSRSLNAGVSFLGFPPVKMRTMWISADRSGPSFRRTLDRCQIRESEIGHVVSLVDQDMMCRSLDDVFKLVTSDTEFLIIDPISGIFGENFNSYQKVKDFMIEANRFCRRRKITILGLIHTRKMRERDRVYNPRERLLGSVAWAGYAETILYVEQADLGREIGDCDRRLLILPRNAQPEEHIYRFDDSGRLLLVEDQLAANNLRVWVTNFHPIGGRFRRADALLWGNSRGIATRTVEMHIQAAVSDGLLHRVDRGLYERRR